VIILVAILIYHCVAYAFRVREEYKLWDLQRAEKQAPFWGGIGVVSLADDLYKVSLILQKIIANQGAIAVQGQQVLTKNDAEELKSASKAAQDYAKRFEKFPKITLWRFWFWDVGVTILVVLVPFFFAATLLTGRELLCRVA
jgi:hypothetical protein